MHGLVGYIAIKWILCRHDMEYRVYDIDYDTSGQEVELAKELVLNLDDDAEPSLELADAISNETGWCVNSFSFEPLGQPAPKV